MAIPLLAALLGAAPLEVGDRAPDFTLAGTGGGEVTLSKERRLSEKKRHGERKASRRDWD